MQNPFSMSPQAVSALLGWIDNKNEGIFWVKSLEGKQLYVGEEFETIFERPCQLMYDMSTITWTEALIADDRQDMKEKMLIRRSPSSELIQETLFRIHVPGDRNKYLRDCCVKLFDQGGKLCAFAGIAQALEISEWEQLYKIYRNQKDDTAPNNSQAKLTDIIDSVLKKEFGLNSKPPAIEPSHEFHILTHEKQLPVSRREFQCLFHLVSGKTAKETGAILFLSQRTVETYLDSIKRKLNCRTKLEILSKIDINHLLATHLTSE